MTQLRIYLASSWRNELQPIVLEALRRDGMLVYDFRNPPLEQTGFSWREVDPEWKSWDGARYVMGLEQPPAARGFRADISALYSCDACVLLHPCGPSTHLEAGIAIGLDKPTVVAIPKAGPREPELMIKAAPGILVLDDPPGNCEVLISAIRFAMGNTSRGQQLRREAGWKTEGNAGWYREAENERARQHARNQRIADSGVAFDASHPAARGED